MRKCLHYFLLMIGIVIVAFTIYLYYDGMIGFDRVTPKLVIQDDYEIVFSSTRTNEFYFITNDGSITEPFEPFFNDPNTGWWQGVGVMHLITWSLEGDLFATRSNPSGGIPVLLTNEGEFIKCGGNEVPIADGRVWVFEGFTVITPDQNRKPNAVILYDMESCSVVSVLYEAEKENVVIEEAAISSQGWLAISGYDRSESWVKIIAPDRTEFKILNAFYPSWSRDGEHFVFSVLNDGIFIADKSGGNVEKITENIIHANTTYPSWAPDGEWIIYSVDGDIYKYNIFTKIGELLAENGHHPNWRWTVPD